MVVKNIFTFNPKLGINTPEFEWEWDEYSLEEQLEVINQWEKERAKIPDRIKEMENQINELQDQIFEVEFEQYLEIHQEIVQLASAINDLNIWYRIEGELTGK